jgi:hypothetical protein
MQRYSSKAADSTTTQLDHTQVSGIPATGPEDNLVRPRRPSLRYAPAESPGLEPAHDPLENSRPPIKAGQPRQFDTALPVCFLGLDVSTFCA